MEKTRQVDILIKKGLIVTLDPNRRIIRDGAIAIEKDRIVGVGKTPQIEEKYSSKMTINADNMVVLPGFVDGHVHLTEHLTRGFVPDDVGALPWIYEWILPIYSSMNDEEEYYSSTLAFIEMIKTGTTTFCEAGTIINGLEGIVEAMEKIGIRGVVGRFSWDLVDEPERLRHSTDSALRTIEDSIDKFNNKAQGRVKCWAMLVGVGTASDSLIKEAKGLADKKGVGLNMHQSMVPEEVEEYMKMLGTSKRPIEHFEELGILDKNLRLVHMIDVSDKEIELLQQYNVKVVHCDSTALRLGYGATKFGKFPEMLKKGICVCLGCDGANCSNHFDMGRAIYLAAGLYKDCRRDVNMIPAETALEMGTINGAKSILWDNEIGSIEEGKKADIVLFNRRRPEWVPMLNVVNNIVYSADGKSVDTVLIDGRVVLEKGKLTTVDEYTLYDKIQQSSEGLLKRIGLPLRTRWPVE